MSFTHFTNIACSWGWGQGQNVGLRDFCHILTLPPGSSVFHKHMTSCYMKHTCSKDYINSFWPWPGQARRQKWQQTWRPGSLPPLVLTSLMPLHKHLTAHQKSLCSQSTTWKIVCSKFKFCIIKGSPEVTKFDMSNKQQQQRQSCKICPTAEFKRIGNIKGFYLVYKA